MSDTNGSDFIPNRSRKAVNKSCSKYSSGESSGESSSSVLHNKTSIPRDYGGLGQHYYDKLGHNTDKILQVDIVHSITESRGSVRKRSVNLAIEISKVGVLQEDIVVIYSSSQADQTIAVLASLFIGAIVAPLDPAFDFKDACQLLKKLKPKLIFTDIRMRSQIERILVTLNINVQIISFGHEASQNNFLKLSSNGKEVSFNPVFIEDTRRTVAFIMPTQGTTGPPKLVCLSHQNIYVETQIFIDIFNDPDKILSFFPMALLLQTVLICVSFESNTTIILPGSFTEKNACKFIHDYKITHAALGTDFAMKVVHSVAIKDYNINSLKSVLIGALNTTKQDILRMQKSIPKVKFLQYYFSTETGCITATKMSNYEISLDKPGSAGNLTMSSKMKIIDMNTKQTLGANKCGEVYYTGEGLMLGYFKDNEATLASLEKGYFKTGDLGMYDDDGWFYFQERIEDIIIREGEILCPSLQLEDLIISHPNINDAVVLGNGKEIVAIVKKIGGKEISEEGLRKFIESRCPEKNRPTRIIFLESFPKTSLGHVQRRVLRRRYLEIQIERRESLASISL